MPVGRVALPEVEADLRVIVWIQAVRAFVYGFGSILIGDVLASGGLSAPKVGLVFSAMLAGMALSSLAVGLTGERIGRRRLYLALFLLMAAAGTAFALTTALPVLIAAALTGTLSTDANESGPITSLEQAMMGQAPAETRARVFGRYNAIAYLAGSFGALAAGGPDAFRHFLPTLPPNQTWLLAIPAAAATCALLTRRLTPLVEAPPEKDEAPDSGRKGKGGGEGVPGTSQNVFEDQVRRRHPRPAGGEGASRPDFEYPPDFEPTPQVATGDAGSRPKGGGGGVHWASQNAFEPKVHRRPHRSGLRRSKKTVRKLAALFALDSFGGGFIVQTFLVYWFKRRFGTGAEIMGAIFFATGLLQAGSSIVAGRLGDRIGLLNTMVFTHLPSNVLLAIIPFAGNLPMAAALLLARSALSQMDVPARQAYVVAMVDPSERTAAAAYTNTTRYIARPAGPIAAGALIQGFGLGAPFVAAGALKIVYDLTIYAYFRRIPLPETVKENPK